MLLRMVFLQIKTFSLCFCLYLRVVSESYWNVIFDLFGQTFRKKLKSWLFPYSDKLEILLSSLIFFSQDVIILTDEGSFFFQYKE